MTMADHMDREEAQERHSALHRVGGARVAEVRAESRGEDIKELLGLARRNAEELSKLRELMKMVLDHLVELTEKENEG